MPMEYRLLPKGIKLNNELQTRWIKIWFDALTPGNAKAQYEKERNAIWKKLRIRYSPDMVELFDQLVMQVRSKPGDNTDLSRPTPKQKAAIEKLCKARLLEVREKGGYITQDIGESIRGEFLRPTSLNGIVHMVSQLHDDGEGECHFNLQTKGGDFIRISFRFVHRLGDNTLTGFIL